METVELVAFEEPFVRIVECRIVVLGLVRVLAASGCSPCRIMPVNLSLLPFCRIAVLHVECCMQECRLETV